MAVSSIVSAINTAVSSQQQTSAQSSSSTSTQSAVLASLFQTSSSSTQFSSLGQTKLSLDNLQARASSLASFEGSPNFTDLQVVVLGFIQAFNTVHTNVTSALEKDSSATDNTTSTSATDSTSATSTGSASSTLAELTNALNAVQTEASTAPALEQIGITQAQDGSLSVDQNALEKAFKANPDNTRNVLSGLGQRVERAAEKVLSHKADKGQETTTNTAPVSGATSSAASSAVSAYNKVAAL